MHSIFNLTKDISFINQTCILDPSFDTSFDRTFGRFRNSRKEMFIESVGNSSVKYTQTRTKVKSPLAKTSIKSSSPNSEQGAFFLTPSLKENLYSDHM